MPVTDYDELLAEIGVLAKAMPAVGDAKVEAAAKEGGMEPNAGGEEPLAKGTEPEEEEDDEGGDDMMGKSFQVTMPDGTVAEVFDGSQMMKALTTEVETLKGSNADLTAKLEAATGELSKSLQAHTGLLGMVKSLQGDVARLGAAGRGRSAQLTVLDKPAATAPVPATDPAADGNALMAKAMDAFTRKIGGITSTDIASAEARLNRGLPFPADLAARLPA